MATSVLPLYLYRHCQPECSITGPAYLRPLTMQNTIPNTQYTIRSTQYTILNTQYKLRNMHYACIHKTKCKLLVCYTMYTFITQYSTTQFSQTFAAMVKNAHTLSVSVRISQFSVMPNANTYWIWTLWITRSFHQEQWSCGFCFPQYSSSYPF